MTDRKINFKYLLIIIVVVIFTWFIHEFAHWSTSELLGYETIMRINGTSTVEGNQVSKWHKILISASGPLVTLLQGVLAFIVLKFQKWNKLIYALLFTACYMRFLAGVMNFINPNDEGRISAFLEIGTFTLPLIMSGILFLLVLYISRKYRLDWKFQVGTTIMVLVASSVLILSDQFFGIRII